MSKSKRIRPTYTNTDTTGQPICVIPVTYLFKLIVTTGIPTVIVGLIAAIRPETYDMSKTYYKDVMCGSLKLTAEIMRDRLVKMSVKRMRDFAQWCRRHLKIIGSFERNFSFIPRRARRENTAASICIQWIKFLCRSKGSLFTF